MMIRNLKISGFRGFSHFELRDLGRINLLVGTNNCGKTSILEAVQLISSKGDAYSIWQVAARRGERLVENSESPRVSPEVDICHLFCGHEIEVGAKFVIGFEDGRRVQGSFSAQVVEKNQQGLLFEESSNSNELDELDKAPGWELNLSWSDLTRDKVRLPLTSRGGVSSAAVRRGIPTRGTIENRISFVSTAGLEVWDVISMFEEIVLTRGEELVLSALRTIEPKIERIATVGDRRRTYPGERGGIVVKFQGVEQRIPIGSMGDGMWRMLGLALAIVSAENGILLVDEIDTGLHFSVLERMWKLIDEASGALGVQVFATTHSRDAYESLAAISSESVSNDSEVTIHRIDRMKSSSVSFSEREIVAAAERGMEVR